METLVLHPEELFDKAARGLATPDELSRLDAHVAECTTCRFERQVRMDFDAIGGSTADLDGLVARALSGAKAAVPEAPRRRRVGPLLIAAAVALMGFGSFAAVAQLTGVLPKLFETRTEALPVPAPRSVEKHAAFIASEPTPVIPSEVEGPAPFRLGEVEGPSTSLGVNGPAPVAMVHRAAHPRRALTVTPVREEVIEATPDLPPAPPPEPNAAVLFARATQARVRGDALEALRGFRDVVSRFPASPEATLSQAQLGRLLLDRGEASAALQAFDAYLGSKDQALREEVQGARAMSLQLLGRFDDERSAWEAVLHDYPSGVYAPRARTRLESLTP